MAPRMGQAKYDTFEALFEREQRHIFTFAMYRTHDRDVANDIVSETFAAAWDYRTDILSAHRSTEEAQRRYLFGIARTRIAAHWRTKRRKTTVVTFSQAFAVIPAEHTMALADDGGIESIVEACDSAMAAAMLRAALRACTPTQLQIIQMRYGQHLPEPEVAERLGMTRATYLKRHALLMQHLATVLGGNTQTELT